MHESKYKVLHNALDKYNTKYTEHLSDKYHYKHAHDKYAEEITWPTRPQAHLVLTNVLSATLWIKK